ncbi:hypothetical protein AAZX31_10G172300 [Glycine max]|uniref:CRIB domain-containing protein n=2 Tax=Glycine subgen. Soja TaxID=1462606 RepID=K7LK59_SOYBN|nr:CRIB domain-containing protein RIC3 [Glycine max]XP_028182424.1 CRIB domain-containing protein RIC3-like [Glycine soja]KAG4983697.1 hypothetical protein JHK87_028446 [Glycine soja]KAG4997764.1 hypothetical protein JHK85_029203 [Glycine max]KAG5004520.1 hypothetical protein JHK86_028659 [Glycine max]KAG5127700.1 hypothetical protein JHK82_028535 [Glycine max]KAG5152313.1 hypothetical protein JHK84_028785 [Glycine max]|eukprot:XP_003535428.1 CRIB domain-containing protein RIC3 [Glycine max]
MSSGAVKGPVKGQMKGLLKGLRYISQIFDEEDEKEIQIGFPTDVKHLAHIGAENAKASQPSWLSEFKELSEGGTVTKGTSEGDASGIVEDDANSKGEGSRRSRKSRPRSTESQSSMTPDICKPSRRHHSESSRRMSRHSSEEEKTSKPTHRRKSKTSEEKDEKEGSSRRAPRSRRQPKGDSLTDFSFSDSGPSGPN